MVEFVLGIIIFVILFNIFYCFEINIIVLLFDRRKLRFLEIRLFFNVILLINGRVDAEFSSG